MKKNLVAKGIAEYKRSVWVAAIFLLIPICALLRCISKAVMDVIAKKKTM